MNTSGPSLSDLTNDSSLSKRITGAAHNLAFEYGADPEDVHSEIVLAILERYADEPEFLEQTEAYIVNFGAWRARNELNRESRSYYNRTVDGDAPLSEDGASLLDLLPGAAPWQDVDFSIDVEQVVESLAERDQQICRMVGGGWTADEIAEAVDCSRRTVYYRLNHPIKDTFAQYA